MKKILAILSAMVLCLCLYGCSDTKTNTDTKETDKNNITSDEKGDIYDHPMLVVKCNNTEGMYDIETGEFFHVLDTLEEYDLAAGDVVHLKCRIERSDAEPEGPTAHIGEVLYCDKTDLSWASSKCDPLVIAERRTIPKVDTIVLDWYDTAVGSRFLAYPVDDAWEIISASDSKPKRFDEMRTVPVYAGDNEYKMLVYTNKDIADEKIPELIRNGSEEVYLAGYEYSPLLDLSEAVCLDIEEAGDIKEGVTVITPETFDELDSMDIPQEVLKAISGIYDGADGNVYIFRGNYPTDYDNPITLDAHNRIVPSRGDEMATYIISAAYDPIFDIVCE